LAIQVKGLKCYGKIEKITFSFCGKHAFLVKHIESTNVGLRLGGRENDFDGYIQILITLWRQKT